MEPRKLLHAMEVVDYLEIVACRQLCFFAFRVWTTLLHASLDFFGEPLACPVANPRSVPSDGCGV